MGLFPGRLAQLIEAFYGSQFPTFPDLLEIWCGGNLVQNCSFCGTIVKVVAVCDEGIGTYMGMPTVSLLPHMAPTIFCGQDECLSQFLATGSAWNKWSVAVRACFEKLELKSCDYCFKLANEVHR